MYVSMQVNDFYSRCVFSIGGTYFYTSRILQSVKHAAASFASLLVQFFQMVLLKLGYDFKGTFLIVFLDLHTKPLCVSWVLFLRASSLALQRSSVIFGLTPVFLPFFNLYSAFHTSPHCFERIKTHTCEICVS